MINNQNLDFKHINAITDSSSVVRTSRKGSLSDRLVDRLMGSMYVHITVGSH